jgi:DNA-binding NtrC family response regulator
LASYDRTLPGRTHLDRPIEILSVSSVPDDHVSLRKCLSGFSCSLATASTCNIASQSLNNGRVSIVVCEKELPDGTWRNVLNAIQTFPDHPYFIVTTSVADLALWAEVLNLGGFDVLAKPFVERDARHVLESAYIGSCRRGTHGRLRLAASAS